MLLLFGILILNFGISCWNAYTTGRAWSVATGWLKVVCWAALIMSVCGFIEVTAIVLGFVAVAAHWINHRAFDALVSSAYLLIIVPVLGAGLVITIHSWVEAYKRRDFGSIATAGWNTFAQGYNTYEALDGGVLSAFSSVSSFFKSDDDDDESSSAIVLLILLVSMMIAGGLTAVFFQMGRRADLTAYRRREGAIMRGGS